MEKPKYYNIVVTDFELRMLASLPGYKLRTDGKSWKSLYLLQDRIFKRNAAVLKLANIVASAPADDEPAVTCYVTSAENK